MMYIVFFLFIQSIQFVEKWSKLTLGARRMMRMHMSFCRELIVLPAACTWSLDTYCILSPIYHLHVYLLKFHINQGFVFIYHILHFYLQWCWIFNLWEFYHSHPSAGNKQSVFLLGLKKKILNFPSKYLEVYFKFYFESLYNKIGVLSPLMATHVHISCSLLNYSLAKYL